MWVSMKCKTTHDAAGHVKEASVSLGDAGDGMYDTRCTFAEPRRKHRRCILNFETASNRTLFLAVSPAIRTPRRTPSGDTCAR